MGGVGYRSYRVNPVPGVPLATAFSTRLDYKASIEMAHIQSAKSGAIVPGPSRLHFFIDLHPARKKSGVYVIPNDCPELGYRFTLTR